MPRPHDEKHPFEDHRMRSYASSKLRLTLLAGLLATSFFVVRPLYAAGPASAPVAAAGEAESYHPFSLVLDNIDFVFVIIAALSVTGMALIIHGFMRNRQEIYMPATTLNRIRGLIESRNFEELATFTAQEESFVSKALFPAVRRYPDFERMREAMETSVSELTAESFRRIEYLNIIGNLGPLLGLLGTVLGMIEAFQAMHAAGGQANPAQLAGGISKALAHTMLGLLLAIPCLAAFGMLRTMVDRLTNRAAMTAEDLLLMLRPEHPSTRHAPPAVRHAPAIPANP
jgi:biopolymer transport protein ExbB